MHCVSRWPPHLVNVSKTHNCLGSAPRSSTKTPQTVSHAHISTQMLFKYVLQAFLEQSSCVQLLFQTCFQSPFASVKLFWISEINTAQVGTKLLLFWEQPPVPKEFFILIFIPQILFRLIQTQTHVYGVLQVFNGTCLLKILNLIAWTFCGRTPYSSKAKTNPKS